VYYTDANSSQWVQTTGAYIDTALTNRVATIESSKPLSPNYIINGGFDIWQRGTTSSTSAAYIADRWFHLWGAGTATVSRSTDVPETTLQYSLSFASTSGTTPILRQNIESVNALPLVGQTVTLSIWAKSTVGTGGLSWTTAIPTVVDTFGTVAQDQTGAFAASMTVGTWTRYSATFTVGAGAVRGLLVQVYRTVTATSTTTLYAGAQLELGSVATSFRRNAPSIQAELAACQRYYQRMTQAGIETIFGAGVQRSTTTGVVVIHLPVELRTLPTSVVLSNVNIGDQTNFNAVATLTDFSRSTTTALTLLVSYAANGAVNRPMFIQGRNGTPYDAVIQVIAEL
jgi:hypothetical protein